VRAVCHKELASGFGFGIDATPCVEDCCKICMKHAKRLEEINAIGSG